MSAREYAPPRRAVRAECRVCAQADPLGGTGMAQTRHQAGLKARGMRVECAWHAPPETVGDKVGASVGGLVSPRLVGKGVGAAHA